MIVRDPARELNELWSRSAPSVARRCLGVLHAVAKNENTDASVELLADELAETMALADLIGRRRLLLEADAADEEPGKRDMLVFSETDAVRGFPEVPFVEAIADLLTREPRLAQDAEAVSLLYRDHHAFALARSAEFQVTERVQKILLDASRGTVARMTAQKLIEEAGPFTRAYAEVVYRTNLATANAAGRFAQARHPAVAKVIAAFERWEIMDSDVRRGRPQDHGENHAAGHGLIASVNDPIWETHSAPAGYQCLLPGEVVAGNFDGALEARYSGPAVEIETVRGHRLRVTVNHPVATLTGWKPAHRIAEGDELLCDLRWPERLARGIPTLRRAVDREQGPARVEDVFEALAREGAGAVGARTLPIDLHGDALSTDGKIRVVGSYRCLPVDGEPELLALCHDLQLAAPEPSRPTFHGASRLDTFLDGTYSPARGGPGAAALAAHESAVIGRRPEQSPLLGFGLSLRPHLHASPLESVEDDVTRHPQFLCYLADAFAGLVAPDRVVHVHRHDRFHGHVYDLRSATGWMIASGVVISNCRGGQRFMSRKDVDALGLIGSDGMVKRHLPAGFARYRPHPRFAVSPHGRVYRGIGLV